MNSLHANNFDFTQTPQNSQNGQVASLLPVGYAECSRRMVHTSDSDVCFCVFCEFCVRIK